MDQLKYKMIRKFWKSCQSSWKLSVSDHMGLVLILNTADSVHICHLTGRVNSLMEIRRSHDRIIFTMEFPILVKRHLYIELGTRFRLIFAHWGRVGQAVVFTNRSWQPTTIVVTVINVLYVDFAMFNFQCFINKTPRLLAKKSKLIGRKCRQLKLNVKQNNLIKLVYKSIV